MFLVCLDRTCTLSSHFLRVRSGGQVKLRTIKNRVLERNLSTPVVHYILDLPLLLSCSILIRSKVLPYRPIQDHLNHLCHTHYKYVFLVNQINGSFTLIIQSLLYLLSRVNIIKRVQICFRSSFNFILNASSFTALHTNLSSSGQRRVVIGFNEPFCILLFTI